MTGVPQQSRASLFFSFLLGWVVWDFLLFGSHVDHGVQPPDAIAIFVAISGNELYNIVTESNASPSIKGGRVGVTVKDTRGNLVLSVSQDSL